MNITMREINKYTHIWCVLMWVIKNGIIYFRLVNS